jgi:hypothetical protein
MSNNTFVFIAGPYSAPDGGHDATYWYEIDQHINEARRWATKLAELRIAFFCPHMNSAHLEVLALSATKEFYYEMDMVLLEWASAVLLIPGWQESPGAQAEKKRAHQLNIPCFTVDVWYELVDFWNAGASRKD